MQEPLVQQKSLQKLLQLAQQEYLEKLVRLAQQFGLTQQVTSSAQEKASQQVPHEQQSVQDCQAPLKQQPSIPLYEKQQFEYQLASTKSQQHLVSPRIQVFQPQLTYVGSQPFLPRQQINQLQAEFFSQQVQTFFQEKQQTLPEKNVPLQSPSFSEQLSVQQQLVSSADQKQLPLKQKIINLYTLLHYLTASSDTSFTKDYLRDHLNSEYLNYIYIRLVRSLQKDSRDLELIRRDLRYKMKAVSSYLVTIQNEINCGVIAKDINSINDMKNFNQLLKEKMQEDDLADDTSNPSYSSGRRKKLRLSLERDEAGPHCDRATRGRLATDHVILNHGQATWMAPDLAPPSPNYTPHQREDVSALDRFNVLRFPTRWVFSGTGLELVTMQAMIRYLYRSIFVGGKM
ncbi:uncharacterized protein TNCV_1317561 [Trichonephila clavipes]|nr:uncharacterized protein TNCV_1317561 [Trichonephila clavipes]